MRGAEQDASRRIKERKPTIKSMGDGVRFWYERGNGRAALMEGGTAGH
jgi:hypothetical protein